MDGPKRFKLTGGRTGVVRDDAARAKLEAYAKQSGQQVIYMEDEAPQEPPKPPDDGKFREAGPREPMGYVASMANAVGEAFTGAYPKAANAFGQAASRMDLSDKLMAPVGSGMARALEPSLPVNQPGSVSAQRDESLPARPLHAGDPMAAFSTRAGAEMQQDMRAREEAAPAATVLGDVAQSVALSRGLPSSVATGSSLPARMGFGAAEGVVQGAAGGIGAAPAGSEDSGDAAVGGMFGGLIGGVFPAVVSGLQAGGRKIASGLGSDFGDPKAALLDRALAAGAKPSITGRGGLELPERMASDAADARQLQPGAPAAAKAYKDLTDMVLPRLAQNVEKTLTTAKSEVDGAVAKYPNLRVSTEPLRNQVNAILAKEIADVTPEAAAAGRTKAAQIQGVDPLTDAASLSAESDLPLGSAASLRRFAQKLTRRLPQGNTEGQAVRGSASERALADNAPSGPTHRLAEFTVPELVELRRELDQHGKQASKLGQDDLVRSWRELGDTVRGMLKQHAPDVAAVAEKEHQALNALEARLAQLGFPEGTRTINAARGQDWKTLNAALIADPMAMRTALAELGDDLPEAANYASGTMAAELLQGSLGAEGLARGAEAATWKNPTAAAMSIFNRVSPRVRAAGMQSLPNDSPLLRRGSIVGMLPTFRPDEEPANE